MIQLPETTFDQQIMNSIHNALVARIEKIRADIIKHAEAEFDKAVREAVGTVAINLTSYYSLERLGTGELRITVKVGKP